jgi:hypothetical protein
LPVLERRAQVSDLTIKHELEVMDVKAAFHAAIKETGSFSIDVFSTWPLLNEFRAYRPDNGAETPVMPDGFIHINEKAKDGSVWEHTPFFLELDRSNEVQETLVAKETLSQARELAADAKELTAATDGRLTDHLATVLAARYAAALAGWDGEVTEEFRRKLRVLRSLCQDIVELRRGDHSGARLNIKQERLEREREKTEEEVVEHFKRWATNPEVRDWICQDWVSPEERERRLCVIFGREPNSPDAEATDESEEKERQIPEIYGLPPKPPEEAATNGPESSPVKPNQTESNQIKPDHSE